MGTAAGDLIEKGLNLGYWVSALIFAGAIALVAGSYLVARCVPGRLPPQPRHDGGLGTVGTSAVFLTAILRLAIYRTVRKRSAPADG